MVSQFPTVAEDAGTSRGAILESATEVFMEVGFSGARVDEIARRAKANKAMIYYHFGSKQGLYKAVLFAALRERARAKSSACAASDMPPDEKLRALYTRIAASLHREEGAAPRHPAGDPRGRKEHGRGGFAHPRDDRRLRERDPPGRDAAGASSGSVHPLLLHLTMLGPLMLHFAGASFRERLLPREMPGLTPPSNEDMLAHLLRVLDRSLMTPRPPGPPSQSRPPRKPK